MFIRSYALCVTTSVKPDSILEDRARRLAEELGVPYTRRRNVTLARVFLETGTDRLLIVAPERLVLRDKATGAEYFFHPNLAMLRGLNVRRGWRDVFLDAAGLNEGDSILDCTIGFAGEATLAAMTVGEGGRVVGLESVPELAEVTRDGVANFELFPRELREALRRVQVVNSDHRNFLAACEPKAFDVVYFDPFFGERLPGSENSVSPLAVFGDDRPIDAESITAARRVAKRRVVIKCPRRDDLPAAIAEQVTESITGRKSRVVYHVIEPE